MSQDLRQYILAQIEYWGEAILTSVTPHILYGDGLDQARIHYQYFFCVSVLGLFAVFVIYGVDRYYDRRRLREIRKISYRWGVGRTTEVEIEPEEEVVPVKRPALAVIDHRRDAQKKEISKIRSKMRRGDESSRRRGRGMAKIEPEQLPTFYR